MNGVGVEGDIFFRFFFFSMGDLVDILFLGCLEVLDYGLRVGHLDAVVGKPC